MALFRITAAAGLLYALAPEPTAQAVRGIFGVAADARAQAVPTAEAAVAFCRANPRICIEAARRAGDPAVVPIKP